MTGVIKEVEAREILDSRGNPTIEVDVYADDFIARASVPSGVSTGKHEAVELRDGGRRFLGMGVRKAVGNIRRFIAPRLKGKDCTQQGEIDRLLVNLDGTKNKRELGANALLGVSMAVCRAGAQVLGRRLFEHVAAINKTRKLKMPVPFFNFIEGGLHAGNGMAIQECMIVPQMKSLHENLRAASEIYHELKKIISAAYGRTAVNVGDEGGFAPPLHDAEEALELLMAAIRKGGYKNKVGIALDCAASEFYSYGKYIVGSGKALDAVQLAGYYTKLAARYPIISIEDPFNQDDFASYAMLARRLRGKVQIVADDLTVTNVQRINLAARHHSANCLLLKLNQIGTVSEAIEAARAARKHGWRVMVSHRGGETTDDFISDFAVGIGADFIKAGAPARGERVAKYNQLMRIEEVL